MSPGRPRGDAAAAVGLGGAVAVLLVPFVAPDVWWRDAGELAASFFSVGVSHPTGFPLVHPPGKLAMLAPVGGAAFRANLLMALVAAATIGALFLAIRAAARSDDDTRAGDRFAAALGALGLLGAYTFWLHALTVEVYGPTALCLAAWLAGLLPLLAGPPPERLPRRSLALLAFGFGLGTGAHVTFPLVAGATALPLAVRLLRRPATRSTLLRTLPALVALVGLGALVLLYLPLAAGRAPWRNWGDPSTLDRFAQHLTGARIRRMFQAEMGGWDAAVLLGNVRLYARLVWEQVGPLLLPAAAGAAWLLRRRTAVFAATALGLLADAIFSVRLNPMGLAELQTSLPSYLLLDLWAGVGIVLAARGLARAFPARPTLAAAAVVVPVVALWAPLWLTSPGGRDLSGAAGAAAVARQGMSAAPPGALWVTSSDSLCALTAWLQGVENHRPDLGNVVKQQLWDPVYVPDLARPERGAVISRAVVATQAEAVAAGRNLDGDTQRALLMTIVRERLAAGDPVLFEPGDADLDAPFLANLEPGFPLWRVRPTPVPLPASPAAFDAASGRSVARWTRSQGGALSEAAREFLGHQVRIAATLHARRGQDETALVLARRATALLPSDARAWNNLGAVLARSSDLPGAIAAGERAAAVDPAYRRGWMNLGSWRAVALDAAGAYDAFDHATRLAPTTPDRFRMAFELGRLHMRRGEAPLATAWLDLALTFRPDDPDARRLRAAVSPR